MIFLIPVVAAILFLVIAMSWRVVVPTNDIQVVQRRKDSTAYGRNAPGGNVYYNIPSFIPFFGVKVSRLPIDIFSLPLDGYAAYDSAKVPFTVDVIAFFQIEDAVIASQRVSDIESLHRQLTDTLRGAVRKVLAGHPIEKIMGIRGELGDEFLKEVQGQVSNWGVKVNSIEFMDIGDSEGTEVVTNIMDKERTTIERDSRIQVADNMKTAKVAEIAAEQESSLRDVEKQKTVAVETEKAKQFVKEQEAETMKKAMAVKQVEIITNQEIAKEQARITAEANQQVAVIDADAQALSAKRTAEGNKEARILEGEGEASKTERIGTAEAAVVRAKGLSEAEATLKKAEALTKLNEAGVTVEKLKANVTVETAKWAAIGQGLSKADIKIVSSGQGANVFGIPLNASTGADLKVMLDQLGVGEGDATKAFDALVKKTMGDKK